MEEDLMFRVLFIVSYALFAGVRVYFRGKTLGREPEKDYTETGPAGKALSLFILGYLFVVILYVLVPEWIGFTHIPLPVMVRWGGVVVALISVFLVFWTHISLGRQYSARQEIQQDHLLITEGVYSRVRHPMYTVFGLFSFSVAIISSNLLLLVFSILVFIPFPWLARHEEKMLIDKFGDEYRKYMEQTGRFLPRIRKMNQ